MKKIIIPFLLVMTLVFQSCEETQSPIYDGSQTLAYFDGTSATLEVEINSTGTITVPVGVRSLPPLAKSAYAAESKISTPRAIDIGKSNG